MALAILEPAGSTEDARRFRGEIGSNRYYAYAIGSDTRPVGEIGEALLEPRHRSRLFGPLPPAAQGRIQFEVPKELFDREHRRIQLFSFRKNDLTGPAWSDVVSVLPQSVFVPSGDGLPPLHLSREAIMKNELKAHSIGSGSEAENVALDYREAPLASAMFFGSIGKLLPSVLPVAGRLVGNLIGGGARGGESSGETSLESDEVKALLTQLLEALLSNGAAAQSMSPRALGMERHRGQGRSRNCSGPGEVYAEAQAAPAVLAALPKLLPLLQNALTPETIGAIAEGISPAKLTGVVLDGLKEVAKIGLRAQEQELEHLRKLNPGVDDPGFDQLLLSKSTSVSLRDHGPDYRRIPAISLEFSDLEQQTVHGRSRVLYRLGSDLGFPLELRLPDRGGKRQRIPRALLQVAIKDPETRRVLAGRRFELEDVGHGPLPVVPTIRAERLGRLHSGEDYLVTATLTFKRRKNGRSVERVGTSRSMLITAVGEAIFDRVEGARGIVPLGDPNRDRAFWHKLWQETFDSDRRRVTWATRYAYSLEPSREKNGRLRTKTRIEEERLRHEVGKLKSGMALSPVVLNRLLPRISDHPELTEGELEALKTSEFVERFQQAARGRIEIDADPGRAGALWVWPEVKLLDVALSVPKRVDEYGRVRRVEERIVVFPIPAMIHLVAVRTGDLPAEGREALGGMEVVTERKVALYSTELVSVPEAGKKAGEARAA